MMRWFGLKSNSTVLSPTHKCVIFLCAQGGCGMIHSVNMLRKKWCNYCCVMIVRGNHFKALKYKFSRSECNDKMTQSLKL